MRKSNGLKCASRDPIFLGFKYAGKYSGFAANGFSSAARGEARLPQAAIDSARFLEVTKQNE